MSSASRQMLGINHQHLAAADQGPEHVDLIAGTHVVEGDADRLFAVA